MKTRLILLLCVAFTAAQAQTPQELENLEAFNRLYGYVKYFHPSDEAANVDWDRFAIYGSGEVVKCTDTRSLQQTLIRLFEPLAPSLRISMPGEQLAFSKEFITPRDTAQFKVVTWQHSGLGMPNQKNIYTSARTNRKISSRGSGFGTITTSIDAAKYRNKQFRLTGSVRLIDGPGTGHLWARVDREAKKIGFFDNMGDRPIASNQWKSYEITGSINDDAVSLAFGCFLQATGKLMVDNLNLFVLEGDEWTSVYANSFEKDDPEAYPFGMSGTRGVPEYKTIVTNKEAADGKKSVMIQGITVEKRYEPLFADRCKPGEIIRKEIGGGLTAIVPLALYGNETYTWPRADAKKLADLLQNLKTISVYPANNVAVRVGGIISAWNVFQHFYPYFDIAKVDWPEAFRYAVRETYVSGSMNDYLKTLRRLTAKLKDGHANVHHAGTMRDEGFAPPITWEWIENKLVVTAVSSSYTGLKTGDIVTRVDGMSAEEYFAKFYPYISAATPGWLLYRAQSTSLFGPKDSSIALTVLDESNKQKDIVLTRTLDLRQYYSLGETRSDPIRKVSDEIFYVDARKASMEEIKAAFSELLSARAIICDLRGYPNSNHQLIGHLLDARDTSTKWMQVPGIIYPDQERIAGWQEHGWRMQPEHPHLDAKIFFLLDGRAISYAESFMSFIEHYDLATIVGQPSAGTNGNVNRFQLPGDFMITWTGMKVFKHDGSQLHGVGILPDVYVERTIQGVRENRDEFLEKALELATQGELKVKD